MKRVVVTCVDNTGVNPDEVKKIAQTCGAQFYLRSFLDAQS